MAMKSYIGIHFLSLVFLLGYHWLLCHCFLFKNCFLYQPQQTTFRKCYDESFILSLLFYSLVFISMFYNHTFVCMKLFFVMFVSFSVNWVLVDHPRCHFSWVLQIQKFLLRWFCFWKKLPSKINTILKQWISWCRTKLVNSMECKSLIIS